MRKVFKKMFIGMMMVVGSLCFGSCLNTFGYLDEPNSNEEVENVQLVKSPDVVAYSGTQVLGSTFITINNEPTVERWQSDRNWLNVPELISEAESDYVIKYLAEHPNEGYDIFDCDTYYIQVVGGSYDEYTTEPDKNGATQKVKGTEKMNYLVINGTFTYYNNNNRNSEDIIKISNVPAQNCSYTDSFDGNSTRTTYKFYYITLPNEEIYGNLAGKTQLYLCFDYMSLSQNGEVKPDGKYNDWVIKLTPADGSQIIPPTSDENGNDEEDDDTNIGDLIDNLKAHVEINLSIEERDYLSSHLSIHVRDTVDVEVFIPIPQNYYCDTDDMEIVQSHQKDLLIHGGPNITEYTINGNIVKLIVEFEEYGIRIKTEGINSDVLKYLREKNGDGLTFEVWNYFKGIDTSLLKSYLDKSTVDFTPNYPDLYVNAFNKTESGEIFEDDCTVSPKYESLYNIQETGNWYNNSPYNELYYNK